jgi:hypothetical protein
MISLLHGPCSSRKGPYHHGWHNPGADSQSLIAWSWVKKYTRNEWTRCENTLETSVIAHFTAPAGLNILLGLTGTKGSLYTRETSGEVSKIHSQRVEKFQKYTRNEWRSFKNTLATSGEVSKIHSQRVEKMFHFFCAFAMSTKGQSTLVGVMYINIESLPVPFLAPGTTRPRG